MLSKNFLNISMAIAMISITGLILAPTISLYSGANKSMAAYAQYPTETVFPDMPNYFIRMHPSTFEGDVTHYDPRDVAVPSGVTVVWVNDDFGVAHTVTSGGPDDPDSGSMFDSGEIPFAGEFQLTFDSASGLIGEFPYYCTLHPWITGMISANDEVVTGENFEFKSGTGSTFNITENSRTLLAFIPIDFAPAEDSRITKFYNFSITRNSDNETRFSGLFDTQAKSLTVEIINFAGATDQPDQANRPTTAQLQGGTYRIAGNLLPTETGNYTIGIELVGAGSDPPPQQMRDEFQVQVVS